MNSWKKCGLILTTVPLIVFLPQELGYANLTEDKFETLFKKFKQLADYKKVSIMSAVFRSQFSVLVYFFYPILDVEYVLCCNVKSWLK